MKKLILLTAVALAITTDARAELRGPYTNDVNTLLLLHFDDAAGGSVTATIGSLGRNFYAVDENPASTTPPLVTDLLGGMGYSSGAIDFGNCMTSDGSQNGELFGYDFNNNNAYDGDAGAKGADAFEMSNLNIGNGGQTPFTLEALVAPAYIFGNTNQEIITTDSSGANNTRGFQFRINKNGEVEFHFIGPSPGITQLTAKIPTNGPNAFVPYNWYHVAATYNGTTLTLYWTKLDASIGSANPIGSLGMALGDTQGAILGQLTIGNENRGNADAERFAGNIDEVRISSVARGAGEMQFFSPQVIISKQPESQNIDTYLPVTFEVDASSTTTLGYQWRFNSNNIPGATMKIYSIASVDLTNAGFYDAVITNQTGSSATSQVARLTVGAVNFLAHRWSFTSDLSDSIGGATGTSNGNAIVTGGALVLDGTTNTYVSLPPHLLSGFKSVSFDFWATFGTNTDNNRIFDFGNTNFVNPVVPPPQNYVYFSPRAGGGNHNLGISGGSSESQQNCTGDGILDNRTVHVTCVVDPPNHFMAIYTNGVLEVTNDLSLVLSSLNDEFCWIGRSLFTADPYLNGSIDEFRIYDGALSPRSVLVSDVLGTTNLPTAGPVVIVQPPSDFACAVGQTATFSTVADGLQPIVYQWFKNGSLLEGETSRTLSFTTVLGDDGASIQVWATNMIGSTVYTDSSTPVTLTVVVPTTLAWIGGMSADWNTVTANWNDGSGSVSFGFLDAALFDSRGSSQPTVNLTEDVKITGLSVNSSSDYVLTSSAQNGSLSGQGTLLKQGTGKFTIDVVNSCVGPNIIQGGTLQVGNAGTVGELNSGPITNDATLIFNRSGVIEIPGAVHGSGTLRFDGTGGVVITQTNDYTGPTLINAGTVNLRNSTGLGTTANGTTVANGAQLFIDRNVDVIGEALSLAGYGLAPDNVGALHKGGAGTTSYNAPITLTSVASIGVDGGSTLILTNASGISGTDVSLTVGGAGNTIIGGPLALGTTIASTLTKSGNGTLTLNSPNNYGGDTFLQGGAIAVNADAALSTGTVYIDPAGRLVLGTGVNFANSVYAITVAPGVANGLFMVGDNTNNIVTTVSGPLSINATATDGGHFVGPSSSGYLNVESFVDVVGSGATISVRSGNVRFSGGGNYPAIEIRAGTTSLGVNNGVATNALMDIAGNGSPTVPTLFDLNGFNQDLSGLKNEVAPSNVGWVTNSGVTTGTLTLDLGEFFPYSFGGGIVGNVSLVLSSGTQTLATNGSPISGLYNYTGDTLINGGTLILGTNVQLSATPDINVASGAILDASASGLTLGAGQTLKGNGAINGPVTVAGGGTLSPGASIGTLTFNNTLSLNGNTFIEVNKGAGTRDQVVGVTGGSYGGTLAVSNLGGTLTTNDTFQIFPAGVMTGDFSAITTSPGGGLAWQFNPASGVLSLVSSGITDTPTNITFNVVGGNLELSWPASHLGWILQSQTNNLDTGIQTSPSAWFDVPNSESVTSTNMPLNAANPTVFFRLRLP